MASKHAKLRAALSNLHIDTLDEANKFFNLIEMIDPDVKFTSVTAEELWYCIAEALDNKEKNG